MPMQPPLLIAHRGGSLEAPENTMLAFRHAISLGMAFIELDAQMSKDGVLVVIHDETLDRTTNGSGFVGNYTYGELRKLDAGSHFARQYAGEPIPTLRDVLEVCADASVGVIVELKAPHLYPGMEEKVVALLGEMRIRGAENIWCISFYHDSIRKLRALDPTLVLGYLYEPHESNFVSADDTVQACCPYFRTALARPDQIERAHQLRKVVMVYTVDKEEDMFRVASAGIDGMVSDRPSLLLRVFGKTV